jgi:hypothetical protein
MRESHARLIDSTPRQRFRPDVLGQSLETIAPAPFFARADLMSALRQFRCFTGFLAMRCQKSGVSGIQLGSYADWLIRTYFCYAFQD